MRTLVVAEGRHELNGALQALIHRLAGSGVECNFTEIRRDEDRELGKLRRLHGKGGGFFKRAVRWMILAKDRDFDAIVLLVDEDGHGSRHQEIANAQEDTRVVILRAMGVAVRTFDAWMLADEKALSEVLGQMVPRQSDPEDNRNPKGTCAHLCKRSMALSDMYKQIMQRININHLITRCPNGFGPFAMRLQALKATS